MTLYTEHLQISGKLGALGAEQPTHGMLGLTFKPSLTGSCAP
jgi:hypothetical protein